MDNSKLALQNETKGNMILEDRKKMSLTGVYEVVSFDEHKIILNTSLGALTIKGSNLKMTKLDVQNGEVCIIGEIDVFLYGDAISKKEGTGILSSLFK